MAALVYNVVSRYKASIRAIITNIQLQLEVWIAECGLVKQKKSLN